MDSINYEQEVSEIARERVEMILNWQYSSSSSSIDEDMELIMRLQRRTNELATAVARGRSSSDIRGAYLETEYAIMVRVGRELKKQEQREVGVMEGVEKVVVIDDEGGVCAVCQEEIEAGHDASTMACSHTFHSSCVEEWVRRKPTCPLCRHDISINKARP